jgi:chemotaxis protein methyltransferase CheR
MKDAECVRFLQWVLPRLGKRWPGYRKVRRQVCKRISHRLAELGLADGDAYRRYVLADPQEGERLDHLCRISISRFYRDRGVFDRIESDVLPALARNVLQRKGNRVRCWSAGCGCGEEPYTLTLIWNLAVRQIYPGLSLEVVATDSDRAVIERARHGCYPASSLKELPEPWRAAAFERQGQLYCLKPVFGNSVTFLEQDIRQACPAGKFHLVLCRNLVFTYFSQEVQQEIFSHIDSTLHAGGALVIGVHETLPAEATHYGQWVPNLPIFRKRDSEF